MRDPAKSTFTRLSQDSPEIDELGERIAAGVDRLSRRREEAPRERLLRAGARSLSDAELVAVLLGGGRTRLPLSAARELLAGADGLAGLADASRLGQATLVEPHQAAILAALELAVRLARAQVPDREPLSRTAEVAAYLAGRYGSPQQEVGGALYLNAGHRLLAEREIFAGCVRTLTLSPAPVLTEALARRAAGVVLFHTHPSGDPTPSVADLAFTEKMRQAADLVGLKLVDHLIVAGPGRWTSLRQFCGW